MDSSSIELPFQLRNIWAYYSSYPRLTPATRIGNIQLHGGSTYSTLYARDECSNHMTVLSIQLSVSHDGKHFLEGAIALVVPACRLRIALHCPCIHCSLISCDRTKESYHGTMQVRSVYTPQTPTCTLCDVMYCMIPLVYNCGPRPRHCKHSHT